MGATLVGTLPVSEVNLGLAASLLAIVQIAADLSAKVSGLSANVLAAAQLALQVSPPTVAVNIGVSLPSVTASLSLQFAAALSPLGVSIALLEGVQASIQAGLSSGGLSVWSYTGPASFLGQGLPASWQGVASSDSVQAVVIATDSQATWRALGSFFNTGPAGVAGLVSLGVLGAGQISTGLLNLDALIALQLKLKQNMFAKLTLGAALAVSPPAINLGLKVVPPFIAGQASARLAVQIKGIAVQVSALAALQAELNASLQAGISGGGLSVWRYQGPASGLQSAVSGALSGGLPSSLGPMVPAFGMIIAGAPSSVQTFGKIFIT